MVELIAEILIYLGLAALLGLLLGYLIWGWGTAGRISEARADAAAAARTSVDGSAGLTEQLKESKAELRKQAEEIDRLSEELAVAKLAPPEAPDDEADTMASDVETPETEETVSSVDVEADAAVKARPWNKPPEPEVNEPLYVAGETLEAEKAEVDAALPDPIEPDPAQAIETGDEVTPATVPVGLLSERPEEVDDLKKIKGVGKVMERVLNEKGIYLFQQLGALKEHEVEWVNGAIDAFPGRIHRDRWVEQARALYEEKYGTALAQDA